MRREREKIWKDFGGREAHEEIYLNLKFVSNNKKENKRNVHQMKLRNIKENPDTMMSLFKFLTNIQTRKNEYLYFHLHERMKNRSLVSSLGMAAM